MPDQHKMIFRIEELQPNWLSTNSLRWTYALLSRLAAGIVVGIVFGVVAVLNGGLPFMFLVLTSSRKTLPK
jgi:F0F1-type ATP synthase assembly protein I